MKIIAIICIVFFSVIGVYSQTLLKNGGHENYIKMPSVVNPSDSCFRELFPVGVVPPILNPVNPDGIASACSSPDHLCTSPRTGKAHGGFFFVPKFENPEYELCFPMGNGFRYRVSAYFKLNSNSDLAVDQIGFWLTDWGFYANVAMITNEPSFRTPVNQFYTDKTTYQKIEFNYTAQANETALILGNFADAKNPKGSNSTKVAGGTGQNIAYYYVDDIAVSPIPELEKQYVVCPGVLSEIIPLNYHVCNGSLPVKWYFPSSPGVILSTKDTLLYAFNKDTTLAAIIGVDTLFTQIHLGTALQNPLPDTAFLCQGASISLNADINTLGVQYLWSNGANTAAINIISLGTYSVTITNQTCIYVFNTLVLPAQNPDWHLLKDSFFICGAIPVVVNFNLPDNYKVISSDGQSGKTLSFNQAGVYALKLSPSCSVTDVDTLYIQNEPVPDKSVMLPDAFTPNGDGKNDQFKARFTQPALNYQISVQDRWGKEVFSSFDPAEGWDGMFNGVSTGSDVFVYKLRCDIMTCSELKEVIKIGDVTLVR
ncbi:MAG TPA: T9SS type B sorting domain-containing protein [Saprospiraceae bacterium]|nr:T9SS type B sorting domain-containing protein [Saprospiraceae bacterium]